MPPTTRSQAHRAKLDAVAPAVIATSAPTFDEFDAWVERHPYIGGYSCPRYLDGTEIYSDGALYRTVRDDTVVDLRKVWDDTINELLEEAATDALADKSCVLGRLCENLEGYVDLRDVESEMYEHSDESDSEAYGRIAVSRRRDRSGRVVTRVVARKGLMSLSEALGAMRS